MFCRQGFVPAESVMNFRKQLGCDTFRTEEKGTALHLKQTLFKKKCILKEVFKKKPKTLDRDTKHTCCYDSECFFFLFTADPEEFITVLFQKVLCMEPLLKLR